LKVWWISPVSVFYCGETKQIKNIHLNNQPPEFYLAVGCEAFQPCFNSKEHIFSRIKKPRTRTIVIDIIPVPLGSMGDHELEYIRSHAKAGDYKE